MISDGVLWTSYQRMVIPAGPVSGDYVLNSDKYRDDLLRFFKECILIRSGSGFVASPDAWYTVLCDQTFDLLDLSAKTRRKVRRGLKNCEARRINVKFVADNAWPVYSSAFRRYQDTRLKGTENEFKRDMMLMDGFEDIIHYWGVFEKATGRLIAYAQNYLYDKIEVNYWDIKFHPDFLRLYSSYALFYEMNKCYLNEEKFSYVNAGFRNLLHETNVQDYLISKFHFRKQPIGLKIFYRPFIGKCILSTYSFRYLLRKLCRPFDAFYKLEEINRGNFKAINELGLVQVPIEAIGKLLTDSNLIRRESGRFVLKSSGLTFFELGEVARLHQNGIKAGFLSSLGFDFLVLLYQAVSKSGKGILIVALRDGKVIGFVSGAEAIRPIYQQLWKDNFLVLPFVAFLRVFSWKTLRNVFDLLVYSFQSDEKKSRALSAELLSMAVEEKFQG
jgi:hypothetical protein